MSFSGEIKEELLRRKEENPDCRNAEILAILLLAGENSSVFQLESTKDERRYFTEEEKLRNIGTVAFFESEDWLNTRLLSREDCRRAFIKGAFLAVGSASDPKRFYHLEFVIQKESAAKKLRDVINSFHLDARITARKKGFVVYLGEGDQICDLLTVMGATVAMMNLENVRIVKEVRNSVNRQVNCDEANIQKTVAAAQEQIRDILTIRDTVGFGYLSPALAELADVRLKQPEATLKELGELLHPPVGKSGVSHRLKRLHETAEQLRSDANSASDPAANKMEENL